MCLAKFTHSERCQYDEEYRKLADGYRAFADREAHGVSLTYENYAKSAAANIDLLGRLLDLPDGKRQPNLLFAATRHAVGFPDEDVDFARHVLAAWDAVRAVILSCSTQTNGPGRCACLLPALAQIDGPLVSSKSEPLQVCASSPIDMVMIMAELF